MSDFLVSVVIPTVNRPKDLRIALQSLLRQTVLPREIIIVDASDGDETKMLVASLKSENLLVELKYFRIRPDRRGTATQRNLGVRESQFAFVSFLDDDVELDVLYLEEISRVFEKDLLHKIGGVGGNILDAEREPNSLRFKIGGLFGLNGGPMKMTRLGHNVGLYTVEGPPFRAEWLSGGICTYRREVFEQLSFEEAFHEYGLYEDAVFSYELSKKMELWVQPTAVLKHYRAISARPDLETLARMRVRNQYHLFKYCIEDKTVIDYMRLYCFAIYLVVFQVGSCVIGGFSSSSREILFGLICGIVDVLMRKFPRRTTTLKNILQPKSSQLTSVPAHRAANDI